MGAIVGSINPRVRYKHEPKNKPHTWLSIQSIHVVAEVNQLSIVRFGQISAIFLVAVVDVASNP